MKTDEFTPPYARHDVVLYDYDGREYACAVTRVFDEGYMLELAGPNFATTAHVTEVRSWKSRG